MTTVRFDEQAPKEEFLVELDAPLLAQAEELGLDLNEVAEAALVDAIERITTSSPEQGGLTP
jgi:post-segregation antitoxin (ccd killing protein)